MSVADRVTFKVNNEKHSVGSDVDSDVSLNDYLRERLNLRGTKFMCKEGGCGACIVSVTAPDIHSGLPRIFSVNSCLVSVTSCQDWQIKTIEGVGNRNMGYHPVQKALAEYNGTQCGYCSPGWVMSMYRYNLLESNRYNLTEYEIENSFGSNTCRCTGSRPILDAFKSFAKDAPKPKDVDDIEDLALFCKDKGHDCKVSCKKWCTIGNEGSKNMIKIHLKDDRVWYRIYEMQDIFKVLNNEGYDSYMLVNGNTARGAYPIFAFPRVLIDISAVTELKEHTLDINLVVGAGTTLTDVMSLFKAVANKYRDFWYLKIFYDHLDLVAHIPVRNIGSVAGNLMIKYRYNTFSSDVFLLFETVGAVLTIVDRNGHITEVTPVEFLKVDMNGMVIVNIKLPPLSKRNRIVTFKIMPRNQNAHAQVNAGYLYKLDKDDETVVFARVVYGGLSGKFTHAYETERYLQGKKLMNDEVIQKALKILDKELVVEEIKGEPGIEYRKKLALGLFYKGLLNICTAKLSPRYRSGAIDLKMERPISKAKQVYDTNPIIWPINEPSPKLEALIQCAGEAPYVNDIFTQPKEVFAAFVTTKVATGDIDHIDATHALKLPGVVAFYTAKDIPGINSFLSQKVVSLLVPEEVLCSGKVEYYDQALGIIVAESEKLANRAALLVDVKYKNVIEPPVLTIDEAKKYPDRISLFFALPATDRGANIQKIINGGNDHHGQYHFTMETQSCITLPVEDGLNVYTSSQWLDASQVAISDALKIDENSINMELRRVGGAYGSKISRGHQISVACSLVAYLLNRPCRFVMSIEANMRVVGKRPPCSSDFEVGVDNSGQIQYLYFNLFGDNGYVFSDQMLSTGFAGIKNCYDRRRWTIKVFNALTDTASNTWFRAPGNFEFMAMTEHIMEHISYEMNMDPVDVRLANISAQDPGTIDVINTIIRDSEYRKRKQEAAEYNKVNRWKKRGIRVAFMSWPVAVVSYYNVYLIVYYGDATVTIKHGGVEMGQGINTKVRQVCAYTLNIAVDKIKIKASDVVTNPNNIVSGGSQTSEAVCFATIKACQLLLDRLLPVREALGAPTWEVLIKEAYNRGINLQTSYLVTPNDQTPYRVAGAAVAEVELDVLTGEHEIKRVDILEDTGLSINPEIDVGQIEGAFIMGVGFWTSEELIYDKKTGELETNRTWTYHVPLAKDIPLDFRISLRRNSFNPVGVLGSKATGEPATCIAVSVAFALRDAIAASREETGFPRSKWFYIDGQFTNENMILAADVRLDEFRFT